jgi:hypothetical protein
VGMLHEAIKKKLERNTTLASINHWAITPSTLFANEEEII